jgi:membrane-associated protease RseP (regulator of RpoE activity)
MAFAQARVSVDVSVMDSGITVGATPSWRDWPRSMFPIVAATLLLVMGIANIVQRATSVDVEDGVLWVERSSGVIAAEVARGSAAVKAGIRPGDVLLALDGQPISGRDEVLALQRQAAAGDRHSYTLLRLGSREVVELTMAPLPAGASGLYYVLAAVGIFTLLVGVAVRTRRPHDQATLHFFWLAVAFFGAFTFSFTGRFDRVDWFFYWADWSSRSGRVRMAIPPCWRAGSRRSICRPAS